MNSNAITSRHSLSSPVPNILKDVVSAFFCVEMDKEKRRSFHCDCNAPAHEEESASHPTSPFVLERGVPQVGVLG